MGNSTCCGLDQLEELGEFPTALPDLSFVPSFVDPTFDLYTPETRGRTSFTGDHKLRANIAVHMIRGDLSSHYKLLCALGTGTYGNVYKAINKATGLLRAIQCVNKDRVAQAKLETLQEQVNVLAKLDHPNITKIIEVVDDEDSLNIVTELCDGGDLVDHVASLSYFSEHRAATLIRDILSALVGLHEAGYAHKSLTAERVLLIDNTVNSPIKLSGFPLLHPSEADQQKDVQACGVLMHTLLCGYPPTVLDLGSKHWKRVSQEAKDLLMAILGTSHPPSAREALNSAWIRHCSNFIIADTALSSKTLQRLQKFKSVRKFQHGIMEFIASQLVSTHETEEMRKVFKQLDTNADGKLSRQELYDAYRHSGIDRQSVDAILSQCDAGGNGCIDFSEFLTATVNWQRVLTQEKLEAAFAVFDTNRDGLLSKDELALVFGMSAGTEDGLWAELLDEADSNNDGKIDMVEFKALLLNYSDLS